MGDPTTITAPPTTQPSSSDSRTVVGGAVFGMTIAATNAMRSQHQRAGGALAITEDLARSVASNVFQITTDGKEVSHETLDSLSKQVANLSLEDFVKFHQSFGELKGPDGSPLGSIGAVIQKKPLFVEATSTDLDPTEREQAAQALMKIVQVLYPLHHYRALKSSPEIVNNDLVDALNRGTANSLGRRIVSDLDRVLAALTSSHVEKGEESRLGPSSPIAPTISANEGSEGHHIRTRTIIKLPRNDSPAIASPGESSQQAGSRIEKAPDTTTSLAWQLTQELRRVVEGPTTAPGESKDALKAAHEAEESRFDVLAKKARELYAEGRIGIGFDESNRLYFADLPAPHRPASKTDLKFFDDQIDSLKGVMTKGRHELEEDQAKLLENGQRPRHRGQPFHLDLSFGRYRRR